MKEDICSQVQLEIQMGFTDLSVKLLREIERLSDSGSVQKSLDVPKTIPGFSDSEWLDTLPAGDSRRRSSKKSEPLTTSSMKSTASFRKSTASSRKSTASFTPLASNRSEGNWSRRLRHWKSAVAGDINRQDSSFRTYAETKVFEVRSRILSDEEFPENCLVRFVLGKYFTVLTFFLIAVNAIWMGYESDVEAARQPGEQRTWHGTVSLSFTIWFIVELLLKITALQKYFFFGNDWFWNMLDSGLVLVSIAEIFMNSLNLSFIRLVRLARLSKAFRLIRLVKFFTSLREILLSLFYTMGALFWSFVALALTTYIFALIFMQWIALQASEGVPYSTYVLESFSSTWNTMLVLFSMISGGLEWYTMVLEFDSKSDHVSKNALLFYIFFTQFGLLNVIIGVFVARATESSKADKHLRIAKEEEETAKKVKDLIQIFNEIDTEQNGYISRSEFKAYFRKRGSLYMLQSLGLQLVDPDQMLQIMVTNDGSSDTGVDLPSFVVAMMRLCGEAKSTELVLMAKRIEQIFVNMRRHADRLEELISQFGPAQHEAKNDDPYHSCCRDPKSAPVQRQIMKYFSL